jgi:hypothetical protein
VRGVQRYQFPITLLGNDGDDLAGLGWLAVQAWFFTSKSSHRTAKFYCAGTPPLLESPQT